MWGSDGSFGDKQSSVAVECPKVSDVRRMLGFSQLTGPSHLPTRRNESAETNINQLYFEWIRFPLIRLWHLRQPVLVRLEVLKRRAGRREALDVVSCY